MIVNNKLIENICLEDIKNIIIDAIGCKDDSINVSDFKLILDVKKDLQEKINDYRDNKVQIFASKNKDKYKVLFHAIPLDAFLKSRIDFKEVKVALQNKQFFIGFNYSDFEGLYSDVDGHHFKKRFFRNGVFEASVEHDYNEVHVDYSKKMFEEFVKECLEVYDKLNILYPIVFFVTFTNVKGKEIAVNSGKYPNLRDPERDIIDPAGVIIKDKNQVESEVHNVFVPIFNHFGIEADYLWKQSENE